VLQLIEIIPIRLSSSPLAIPLTQPSPTRGEGFFSQVLQASPLLPWWEKVAAKLTDEGVEANKNSSYHRRIMPRHPTPHTLRTRARTMRSNQTEAEKALWGRLRDRRLMGLKFKRQVPIGSYIVDFVCMEKHLIVEVDGSQHVENNYDTARDAELTKLGFRTMRFWNNDVLQNIESVCEAIRAVVQGDQ